MENSLRTVLGLVVYEGVGNPIKCGFAFLYEAQHCAGSYGLTSCQTGTNYK